MDVAHCSLAAGAVLNTEQLLPALGPQNVGNPIESLTVNTVNEAGE